MAALLGGRTLSAPGPTITWLAGWMTGSELDQFAARRVTVHASPPGRSRLAASPHLDGTTGEGPKARATPGISLDGTFSSLGLASATLSCTQLAYAVRGMHAMYSANIPRSVGYQLRRGRPRSRAFRRKLATF
jgi:hypothetical protein